MTIIKVKRGLRVLNPGVVNQKVLSDLLAMSDGRVSRRQLLRALTDPLTLSDSEISNTGGSGAGQQVSNLVTLDTFSTWRLANNGADKYFDAYNGATGDAGPSQTVSGVSGNALQVTVPSNNVWYVDADCADYTSSPSHWMQGHIQSGTWDSSINRMQILIRSTIAQTRDSGGSSNCNVGTYIKPLDNTSPGAEGTSPQNGHHYYHDFDFTVTPNKWQKLIVTSCPQHERGDAGGVDHTVISQYFHTMTRFYVTTWGYYPGNSSGTFELGPVSLFSATNEPDDDVRSLQIHHTGTKYHVTWAGRKNVSTTYRIRYRTDGVSMKSAGFASGTDGGTTGNPENDYTGCFWELTSAESVNGIYVAIKVESGTAIDSTSLFHEIYLPYQLSPSNLGLVGV